MPDDLRSTLEAAVATVEKQSAAPAPAPASDASSAPAPAPAPETKAPEGEANPYAEGKGVSDNPDGGESATPPKIDENPAAGAKETKEKTDDQQQQPGNGAERAPQSWKPGAKAKWEAIDPDVRAEVVRREREVTRVLNESATQRKIAQGLQEVVKPFEGRLRAANVNPLQAVQSLLHIDHVMSSSSVAEKAAYAAKWLHNYGVDIGALDAVLSGRAPQEHSENARLEQLLEQRLAPVNEFLRTQQAQAQSAQQQDEERANAAVSRMAADVENYPHFDMVRDDMADVIEINARRGVYLTPEQAYTRAVAMNPEAQAASVQQAQRAQALKANETAQRSMNASLSVSGSPAAVKTTVDPADLRGTIEAAMRKVTGN